MRVDEKIFSFILTEKLPELADHFDICDISLTHLTFHWFLCLFINVLPIEVTEYIWCLFPLFAHPQGPRVLLRLARHSRRGPADPEEQPEAAAEEGRPGGHRRLPDGQVHRRRVKRRAAERGDDCGLQGHGDVGHLTVADSHSARGLRGGGEVRERGVGEA